MLVRSGISLEGRLLMSSSKKLTVVLQRVPIRPTNFRFGLYYHSRASVHSNRLRKSKSARDATDQEGFGSNNNSNPSLVTVFPYPGVGHITVVSLNDSNATMNSLSIRMLTELTNVLLELNKDTVPSPYPPTDAIILTSNATLPFESLPSGVPPVFSSGIDFSSLLLPLATHADVRTMWRALQDLWILLNTHRRPIIAAANGGALGFGYMPILASDIRLGLEHEDAVYSVNHTPYGLVLPPWYMGHLAYLLGCRRAERLCLTGKALSTQEALTEGLFDAVYPSQSTLLEAAYRSAHKLLRNPTFVFSNIKTMMRKDLQQYLATDNDANYDANFFAEFILSDSTQRVLKSTIPDDAT